MSRLNVEAGRTSSIPASCPVVILSVKASRFGQLSANHSIASISSSTPIRSCGRPISKSGLSSSFAGLVG